MMKLNPIGITLALPGKPSPRTARNYKHFFMLVLVLFTSVAYVVRGYFDQEKAFRSVDFKTAYSSARCLIEGCDPYDSHQTLQAYLRNGGYDDHDPIPFRSYEQIYLPSALTVFVPFALFNWGFAHNLWLLISAIAFVSGALLMFRLSEPLAPVATAFAISMLLVTSTLLMMLAQPAQLTIGLCAIAVWCLVEGRYLGTGRLCFAITLMMKPHVTGLIWLYFVLSKGTYRKQAVQIALLTVAFSLPALIWVSIVPSSSHWFNSLRRNISEASDRGNANDPGTSNPEVESLTQMQTLFVLVRSEGAFAEGASCVIGALMVVLWMVPIVAMPHTRERDYLALASIAAISLLPIYHRDYDTRLLLLSFPAFALLVARGALAKASTLAITCISLFMMTHQWHTFVAAVIAPKLGERSVTSFNIAIWRRPLPVSLLMVATLYLGWYYRIMIQRSREAEYASTHRLKEFGIPDSSRQDC